MKYVSRRSFVAGVAAWGCTGAVHAYAASSAKLEKLDAMANSAVHFMIRSIPEAADVIELSSGFLIIPLVTKAAFGIGGGFGEGVLRQRHETLGYYRAVQLNYGFQFGAQQYSQAIFFLNDQALEKFQSASWNGWTFGAEMRYLVIKDTDRMSADNLTSNVDVAGMAFGQAGLHFGVSVEGTKYSKITS